MPTDFAADTDMRTKHFSNTSQKRYGLGQIAGKRKILITEVWNNGNFKMWNK
jgi:hypothetical protein